MLRRVSPGLLAAVALAAAGCGPPEVPSRNLLEALDEADLRADSHSLPDLAADPRFGLRGWDALESTAAGPLAWTLGEASRVRLPLHTRATSCCGSSRAPTSLSGPPCTSRSC